MSKILLPYVADCKIGGEQYNNLQVVDMKNKTITVELPNGEKVKRHQIRHNVTIKYVSPLIGVKNGRGV